MLVAESGSGFVVVEIKIVFCYLIEINNMLVLINYLTVSSFSLSSKKYIKVHDEVLTSGYCCADSIKENAIIKSFESKSHDLLTDRP